MRVYFILLLIPFVSCVQIYSIFYLQNSFIISLKDSICVNEKNCFCFISDSSASYLEMYYVAENNSKKLIDSVEYTPYKSMIHLFKLQKENVYVVLWETEYEIFPLIYAYYITEREIVKIGELLISLPCQSCESFDYPIKDIRILKNGIDIEISFSKDVNYKPKDSTEWQLFEAGALKYIFNTETNELKTSYH